MGVVSRVSVLRKTARSCVMSSTHFFSFSLSISNRKKKHGASGVAGASEHRVGWAGVLLGTLFVADGSFAPAVFALEMVCVFEVVQIALGVAGGNLALGSVLHATRLSVLTVCMPVAHTKLASKLVLLAWSATEVARYSMFLFPTSRPARVLRYSVPVVTFPLGALAEAYIAYTAHWSLREADASWVYIGIASLVASLNLVGGPIAHRLFVEKALDVVDLREERLLVALGRHLVGA